MYAKKSIYISSEAILQKMAKIPTMLNKLAIITPPPTRFLSPSDTVPCPVIEPVSPSVTLVGTVTDPVLEFVTVETFPALARKSTLTVAAAAMRAIAQI